MSFIYGKKEVIGNQGIIFKGVWDASTNTPIIPTADITNKDNYYIVNVAGSQFGINWDIGDWIISNGTEWSKIDNSRVESETYLDVISETPTDTVISLVGDTGSYITKTGQNSNIGTTLSFFEQTASIKIYRNGVELRKSIDVIYVDSSHIKFPFDLHINEYLVVRSLI